MPLLYNKPKPSSQLLDFPELRQIYTYDCGASCAQSILTYYGYEKREDELLKKLKAVNTNIFDNGVTIKSLVNLFKEHKLTAELHTDLKPCDLPAFTDEGVPVIILLQAYKDSTNKKEYKDDYKDGHYVVCVGYDGDTIIFEDPSAYQRTSLTCAELEERWHAVDDNNKPDPISKAIVVKGVKKFIGHEIKHMQ